MQAYDEHANGSEVELSVNDEFEIALPETRTAGYRWTLERTGDPVCTLVNDSSEPNPAVGGAGKRTWRFRAAQAGTATIELAYDRSWKKSPEPARTFTLSVRARPRIS